MAAECGAVGNGNVDKWVEISKECKVGASDASVLCEVDCVLQYSVHCVVLCALCSVVCTV